MKKIIVKSIMIMFTIIRKSMTIINLTVRRTTNNFIALSNDIEYCLFEDDDCR